MGEVGEDKERGLIVAEGVERVGWAGVRAEEVSVGGFRAAVSSAMGLTAATSTVGAAEDADTRLADILPGSEEALPLLPLLPATAAGATAATDAATGIAVPEPCLCGLDLWEE